ncbi:MAG: efflux RND transporter periplasmic adaptor subunit [Cyclobacteriaceae bacterium]|nr:efflux transporter periplasmic adaptor subunit [Cytophagales bacterium]HNP75671.1 efflux RND transporter periplasmic adaptor subunit [Cyclobacteriaceae bacterium]HQQ81786.1 efflux RND transporter periplasmic adaptor subunit [Cyclobacteriaceae bacterium]
MKRLIYILALISVACSKPAEPTQEAATAPTDNQVVLTREQYQLLGIETASAELRQLSGAIRANGMLDVPPQNLVTISAPLGGFVKHTELLQGMKVKRGQVVVVLEHPDYIQMQQDYLDSKSKLEFQELEYKRQQELATENVNALKALQQSKSMYMSTLAQVAGLKAKLKLISIDPADIEKGFIRNTISIPSPISGYVTQININIGMHVNPTEVMMKIVDTEHLHAEAQVFEKDLMQLAIGQHVRLRLSNEQKERYATVYLIGKEITPERTVRVHCHLSAEDKSLIPGMYFSAIIETSGQKLLAVPADAVVSYAGKFFVFAQAKEDKNKFAMVEVGKGISEDGFTALTLPADYEQRQLVTKGTYALLGMLKNKED